MTLSPTMNAKREFCNEIFTSTFDLQIKSSCKKLKKEYTLLNVLLSKENMLTQNCLLPTAISLPVNSLILLAYFYQRF